MEQLYPERQAELVERLAHHAFSGGLWDRAVVYLRQAGAKALSRSAHREAADFLERALTALDRLPESRGHTEQAIDVRLDLRTALLPLGEFARISDHLREAERLAELIGDRRRLGQCALYAAGHFRLRIGDPQQARRAGERALALAESLDDPRLRVAAHAYVGQVLYDGGEYARAAELFGRNVAFVGDDDGDRFGLPQLPSVHSRTILAWCFAELGHFAEGVTRAREAMAIAEPVEAPLDLTVACAGLGVVQFRRGDLDDAREVLERGLALSRTRNIPLWFPRLASTLGAVHVLAGRVEEGERLLDEAIRRAQTMNLVSGQSLLFAALAEARLASGDATEADAHARRALELARAHGERGWEAWTLRTLGDIAVRAENLEQAERYFDGSATLAGELGMRPLAARVRLGRGLLAMRAGKADDARDLITGAATMLRDLAMPWWAARADGALASG
jgi:tetratricopeptide (TPR) repeat protein